MAKFLKILFVILIIFTVGELTYFLFLTKSAKNESEYINTKVNKASQIITPVPIQSPSNWASIQKEQIQSITYESTITNIEQNIEMAGDTIVLKLHLESKDGSGKDAIFLIEKETELPLTKFFSLENEALKPIEYSLIKKGDRIAIKITKIIDLSGKSELQEIQITKLNK